MDTTIKFKEVQFANLPAQDYAKAKEIVSKLSIGEFAKITINSFANFANYIDLLSGNGNYFSIKNDTFISNQITICNTGNIKTCKINVNDFRIT